MLEIHNTSTPVVEERRKREGVGQGGKESEKKRKGRGVGHKQNKRMQSFIFHTKGPAFQEDILTHLAPDHPLFFLTTKPQTAQ